MSRTTIFDDPYVRVIGPDTEQIFVRELEKANCEVGRPDAKGEYTSTCPSHPDRVRSLRWRVSVDGRILLHCHAGCGFNEVIVSMELEAWQLQPVKVEYDYVDREGLYRYTVVRQYGADGKKSFKQGVRDAVTGMWTASVDGVDTNILFRADAIEAKERGEPHTLWLCHSADTEVLTARGWVLWPDVTDEDQLAQVDRETERVSFVVPTAVQRLPYSGSMVHFVGQSLDALVTPDHRMWTARWDGSRGEIQCANDVARTGRTLRHAVRSGHGASVGPDVDSVRLMVAWQADGVWEKRGHNVHFNLPKARKLERLTTMLDRMSIEYERRTYACPSTIASGRKPMEWVVLRKDAHPAFRVDKSIPFSAVNWSPEAREALLEEVAYWDGDRASERSWRYFTRDRASADAVSAVAAVTGVRASQTTQDRTATRPGHSVEYRVNLNKASWSDAGSRNDRSSTGTYDGAVYCATVPNDTLITRRNGRILISGNCEGEKDACVVEVELAKEGRDGEYASSFPGGAGRDLETVIADQVVATGARAVVVVVDRDRSGAGLRRGRNIARWLSDHAPDLAVRIMIPVEGTGKDVAEIVDKFGDGWEARLEAYAFDAAEDAMLDYGASAASGMVVVVRPEVGRAVMAMVKPGKEGAPVAVLTGVIEPEAVHTSAAVGRKYAITVTPQIHVADPMNLEITSTDLSSSQNFLRWLSRCPDFGRAPLSGIPVGDVADGLRMYLDYRVRVAGKPVLVSPEAVGWIDAETGVTADRAGAGRPLVFVDRSGGVVAATDLETVSRYAEPETRHGGIYGFSGNEVAAAWALWQALTFADSDITAPIAGFVGATILSPFTAAAGAGLRPGLTMVAPSGSGKTRGAGSLLLGLGGCSGHQSGSAAGMRRKLEAGVGTMLWFDDTAAVEETRMKEWMRVAITRSEFTLSDTDAGVNAVHGGGLTSVPVVSSEGVGWMAETAMRDRFIAVRPTNPQSRRSMWPGREEEAQWLDVQAVEVGLLRGRPVEFAGWVVAGVVDWARHRGAGDVYKGVEEALTGAERGGVRREWARNVADVGLEAVEGWLTRVKEEAGESWPGLEAGPWGSDLEWLREGWRVWAQLGEDATASAACSLVDEVVPRLLQAHHDTARAYHGNSEYAITGVDGSGKKEMPESVRKMLTVGGLDAGLERGLPPLLVDLEERIWIRTASASTVYQRLVRNAEERTTGAVALASQTQSKVCDDPPWATFIKGGRVQSGVRIRVEGAGQAVYRRLSAMACERARSVR